MYKTISSLGAIAALAATVSAHGITTGVTIDGAFSQGFLLDYYYAKQSNGATPKHIGWYAENLDSGFVEPNSFNTADIICHKKGSPEGSSDDMAKVPAGGVIDFHWNTWPVSHIGPVLTYVAPYTGDIASVNKEELKWTKIQANGYENGEWAAIKLISQNFTWPVTVPSDLKAGKYVFRHEIIALHGGGNPNGAQSYPQCLNIEVTGSGTNLPEGVVGTSLYKADGAGILFDPYKSPIVYPLPGPPMIGGGSGSGTTPTTPTNPSSTPSASPSASPSPSPSAAAPPVATPEAQKPSAPASSSAPAASPSPAPSTGGGESSGALPKEFTIETFISWLESKASAKARRHARAFA
ncbi:hypothetical protein HBI25_006000 [Parastagonospora nodorum]|nr:hypothetical protein HBH71_007480 [Parastagonospora nodorum]KAH5169773.1 hypothetical protein HBI73_006870 [Parastagonospora nodorum]KAH5437568.1 hypothetical protein HBI32_028230 [Parastagonospora nodorum]KAH5575490.1 hypothetical protein HBI25_006000 [Parastagonospora nodorum]KAH5610570.1 hypothetical protein HBI26_022730 [Parastagonospora nodorum]